ncbi:MAG TPA: Uma2 family endonuclease [Pyrinomonadaceae bacterium]|jgi:Uma2 family endonuclease
MLPQEKARRHTPEEYLELERQSDVRHEYYEGEIYAMAGETLKHSQICVNLAREVSSQLKGKPCQALSPNMKVRAQTKGLFAYPDLTVVCGEPIFHDQKRDVLLNPRVIFEVLSPSTERYDRTMKFFKYRQEIQDLTDYIIISQDSAFIEHYEKQADGRWVHTVVGGLENVLNVASINCVLSLAEIYDRVEIAAEEILTEE